MKKETERGRPGPPLLLLSDSCSFVSIRAQSLLSSPRPSRLRGEPRLRLPSARRSVRSSRWPGGARRPPGGCVRGDMSGRFVYWIAAIVTLTAVYACWCRPPLIYDGSYQLAFTLKDQAP